MKQIILCVALLVIANVTFSQQNNSSPVLTKQEYLQKSKKQKTAAWILLGGGFLSTTLGSVRTNPDGFLGEADKSNKSSTVLLVTGIAAIGGSIPLFISSAKNKKRAASVSFRMETTPVVQQQNFVNHSYPVVSFNINFK